MTYAPWGSITADDIESATKRLQREREQEMRRTADWQLQLMQAEECETDREEKKENQ